VGGIMMLAAMVFTAADALLRYLFDAPLSFNFYLTENYLMVGLMTLPMAWGFRTGGLIRITAALELLPGIGRQLLLRAGLLVSCVYVATLAWLAGIHFLDTYQRGDVQMGVIDWPVYWSWVWVPVGLGLLSLRLLVTAFGPARALEVEHSAEEDAV
jgi:TRAP-type C4-dicarboxylate transport system permease small subunit